MSVTRADESVIDSYGDLEVQTIRVNVTTGVGGGAQATAVNVEPVGESELDNDEVGELVYWFRDLTMVEITGEDNGEENSLNAQYEAQVNASPSGGTNPQFATSDEHFGVNGLGFNDDAPILDFARTLPQTGAMEEPGTGFSGGGGGGGGPSNQRDVPFRQLFGKGPFLDNDDHISFRVEAEARGFAGALVVDVIVQAYWRVYTVEGARPTLGPPSR